MTIKVEKFIRPFLRLITDERAELVFIVDGREIFYDRTQYDAEKHKWTIYLRSK